MPASRHVLRDIHEKQLDPTIPYHECGRDGRLTGDEDFRRVRQELAVVELVLETPTQPKNEKPTGEVLKATATVEIIDDGIVIAEAKIEVKNLDATPVVDTDPGTLVGAGGQVESEAVLADTNIDEVVLASSKKIKAKKAAPTAPPPPPVVEEPKPEPKAEVKPEVKVEAKDEKPKE